MITAYKNFDLLEKNVKYLSKFFEIYIHIDKKSNIYDREYLDRLNTIPNVYACSFYSINWGSYLHLMAIALLLNECLKNKEIHRIHIISGEDFPVRKWKDFETFFSVQNNNNYIELTDISNMPSMKLRYEKFHFLHIFNRKSKNIIILLIDKIIRNLQYHLPFKRRISFRYKGLIWASLTQDAARAALDWLTPERVRELKFCEIAEEFFIQNALSESDELRKTIVTDNLRYDNWDGQMTGPRPLELSDYDKIIESNAFFARKFENANCDQRKIYDIFYHKFE